MTGSKQVGPRHLVLGATALGLGVLLAASAGVFGTDKAEAFPSLPGAIGAAVTDEGDTGGEDHSGHEEGTREASSTELTVSAFAAGTAGSRGVDIIPGVSIPSSRAAREADLSTGGTNFISSIRQLNGNHTFIPAVGTFTFKLVGDALVVDGSVSGVAPRIPHAQHIHAGPVCPTSSEDANGDRIIDVVEGAATYGPIIVNLDSDLSDPGVNAFPVANSRGEYAYHEVVNVREFVRVHTGVDPDPADPLSFFEPGQGAELTKRHVVVHGTNKPLPESVATILGLPNEGTLPIGCGEIHR